MNLTDFFKEYYQLFEIKNCNFLVRYIFPIKNRFLMNKSSSSGHLFCHFVNLKSLKYAVINFTTCKVKGAELISLKFSHVFGFLMISNLLVKKNRTEK